MIKLTQEIKEKAVEIALAGGDPIAYLKENGAKNPSGTWWGIKNAMKTGNPEVYGKLPDLRHKTMPKVDLGLPMKAETPEKLQLQAGANYQVSVAETPEEPKIAKPLMHSGKKAIGWEGDFGTYIYDRKQGYIDYESNDGEEISLPVDSWREWLKEIRDVAQLLGVEL